MAKTGKADAFVKALRQAIPVGYREVVPCGDIRQSNCYYSSSDIVFKTRYEADERYPEVKAGKFTLRGGWRVYSSGPGIYISLIVTRLLGLRIEYGNLVIDPVIPGSMDGLSAAIDLKGRPMTIRYKVVDNNFSPKTIKVNGEAVQFSLQAGLYRTGGAVIPLEPFLARLDREANDVEVWL